MQPNNHSPDEEPTERLPRALSCRDNNILRKMEICFSSRELKIESLVDIESAHAGKYC